MESKLREIRERVLGELAKAESSAALEQIRVGVLGKKGELTALLRGMGKLPPGGAARRPASGSTRPCARSSKAALAAKEAKSCKAREKAGAPRGRGRWTSPSPDSRRAAPATLHPLNIDARAASSTIFIGPGLRRRRRAGGGAATTTTSSCSTCPRTTPPATRRTPSTSTTTSCCARTPRPCRRAP